MLINQSYLENKIKKLKKTIETLGPDDGVLYDFTMGRIYELNSLLKYEKEKKINF